MNLKLPLCDGRKGLRLPTLKEHLRQFKIDHLLPLDVIFCFLFKGWNQNGSLNIY